MFKTLHVAVGRDPLIEVKGLMPACQQGVGNDRLVQHHHRLRSAQLW